MVFFSKPEYFQASLPVNFPGLDYSIDDHHHQQQQQQQQQLMMNPRIGETSGDSQIVDYMLHNPQSQHTQSGFCRPNSPDKLMSFADVMQFADFGPKFGAVNQTKMDAEETGIDPVYFLRFPVLNDHKKLQGGSLMADQGVGEKTGMEEDEEEDEEGGGSEKAAVQLRIARGERVEKNLAAAEGKNKRKRPRSSKTSEEVESQRMTHIAVERNRRKQMNEHLRVLRSLMPGSYVQRGDQASIIGGAIEFVRELEQLLQCLESQKRRRLYGDPPRPMDDSSSLAAIPQPPQPPPFFPPVAVPLPVLPNDHLNKVVDFESGGVLREETAESKSSLADVEVKVLGFDAMIKILSRRRPGQLIKTIAALEDLQLNILHTNITTIEQTVLYSFNVKVGNEARFTADDIASSVQQIVSYIHANSTI
ncbi:hypothetical protein U1Q18_030755 [Sarracenia purpurea var. burkii]